MKKFIAIFLSLVLLVCLCGCGNEKPTHKKKRIKKIIVVEEEENNTSSVKSKKQDNSENDDGDFEYIEEDDDDDGDIIAETELNLTTTKIALKKSASNIGENYYIFSPEVMHPGVVGMDAHYRMIAKDRRGREIPADRIIISCADKRIEISGVDVVIPYAVRSKLQPIEVSMYDKSYPNRTAKYTFKFRKFSKNTTFNDDFDTYNTDVWSSTWYDGVEPGTVKDGKYIMHMDSVDTKPNVISTSGKFSQSYGCFSSRILMTDCGLNNVAFWLCTDYVNPKDNKSGHLEYIRNPYRPNQSGGEIDIIEYSPTWGSRYAATHHWYGWSNYHRQNGKEGLTIPGADFGAEYHIYSLVWTETTLYWYLDEYLMWSDSGEGVGSGAMVLLLQLTNYTEDASWIGTFENIYPYEAKVDWVRVWSLDDAKTDK